MFGLWLIIKIMLGCVSLAGCRVPFEWSAVNSIIIILVGDWGDMIIYVCVFDVCVRLYSSSKCTKTVIDCYSWSLLIQIFDEIIRRFSNECVPHHLIPMRQLMADAMTMAIMFKWSIPIPVQYWTPADAASSLRRWKCPCPWDPFRLTCQWRKTSSVSVSVELNSIIPANAWAYLNVSMETLSKFCSVDLISSKLFPTSLSV